MEITLQNEKGKEFKMIDKIGFSKTQLNNQDFICIDAYEGQGKNYKEREQKEITICIEGKDLFCGTIFELKELLTTLKT